MPEVHPTAHVDPAAELADDVEVGPFCYVGPGATVGAGTHLVAHVSVLGNTRIGEENTIWPQATIGADPQDKKFERGEDTLLEVGDRNDIRENVTLHPGTKKGGGKTTIGSDNLLMVGCHVAHDCTVGDHCVISNSVQLAGHIRMGDHVTIAGLTGIHHFVSIGEYAFIGGLTRIVSDVPPFMIVEGNPSKVRGVNAIGLERNGFDTETIGLLKNAYRQLFRGGGSDEEGATTLSQSLEQLAEEAGDHPEIERLVGFMRDSSNGMYGRYQETQRTDSRRSGSSD